ncbi:hypothetical protein [Rhodococcus aetherivorans]|uniref:hypothetical protein n=1 Tax=Rhodococcus aetherivorans TaxID=191292 RepID=UPI00163A9903|nr:hypothetical protein [Rhodococcus aetherivorans]
MASVHEVIEAFRKAPSNSERGTRFEQLMIRYFQLDPMLSQQYAQVWRWMDWPGRDGKPGALRSGIRSPRQGAHGRCHCDRGDLGRCTTARRTGTGRVDPQQSLAPAVASPTLDVLEFLAGTTGHGRLAGLHPAVAATARTVIASDPQTTPPTKALIGMAGSRVPEGSAPVSSSDEQPLGPPRTQAKTTIAIYACMSW